MKRASLIAVALALLTVPSSASTDWMPFDRHEGERRVRSAVDRLGAIVPIPPLACQAARISTRSCSAEVERGLTIEVVTTPATQNLVGDADVVRRFAADDAEGSVYEIRLRLESVRHSKPAAASYFDTLCPALMLAAEIVRSPEEARRRYETTYRRAVNRYTSDGRPEVLKGRRASLVIEANTSGWATCKVSPSPLYK